MTLSITSPGPNIYNADVLQLQNTLYALGFDVTIDGRFGSNTQKAVKNFQYTWGSLTIDGIVGPLTQAALDEAFQLLLEGKWEPSIDPQIYNIISTTPVTITPTGTITQEEGVIEPAEWVKKWVSEWQPVEIAGIKIDWKWILLGIGAAILIVRSVRK